jgi:transcriptional regulator with XRE-family HTH domain
MITGSVEKSTYIAERRRALGMSQVRAAREANVSLGTWLLWEREVGHPNAQNIQALARVLKVDKTELLAILAGRGMLN